VFAHKDVGIEMKGITDLVCREDLEASSENAISHSIPELCGVANAAAAKIPPTEPGACCGRGVSGVFKNLLALIAAGDDIIESAVVFDARLSSHAGKIINAGDRVNLSIS